MNTIVCITAFDLSPGVYPHLLNQDDKDPFSLLIHSEKPSLRSSDPYVNKVANIAHHRNQVRKLLLQTDSEFFLWVDSDMIVPTHALRILKSHRLPIVGGYCPLLDIALYAGGTFEEDGFLHFQQVEPGLRKVGVVGLGCMLMRRDVLEAVEFQPGHDLRLKRKADQKEMVAGSSAHFCMEAKKQGFDTSIDGNVVCQQLKREKQR